MSYIIWDVVQQQQIGRNQRRAAKAQRAAGEAGHAVTDLEDRLERLTLVTQAMWELLSRQLSMSEEQLLAHIERVDLRDGKLDGKISKQGIRCRHCDRVSSRRHRHCLYCGENLDREAF